MRFKIVYITAIMLVWATVVRAQQALDIIRENPTFAATNYALYPENTDYPMTAPPQASILFISRITVDMVPAISTSGWDTTSHTS